MKDYLTMPDELSKNKEMGTRFSVVIPAYNASRTIERAIDSCLQQSYSPYEIIVINDGGTTDTEDIIRRKYARQVRYISYFQNQGVSYARNKGLEAASGDYIAFLDADDIWHKEKLGILNTILENKPDIDFLFHPYTLEAIEKISLPEGTTLYKLPFVRLLLTNTIATPCVTARNDEKLRFNTRMKHMEDYDLWLRTGYKHKLYFINLPLTQLGRPVLSPGGLSENRWKMRKGELRVYARLAKLNPLFILLLPFLFTLSLLKHFKKMVFR